MRHQMWDKQKPCTQVFLIVVLKTKVRSAAESKNKDEKKEIQWTDRNTNRKIEFRR